MESPKSLKEVQRLNGRLIALSRFLSRIAEKSLPFITTLKECLKKNQFKWTQEAELSFQSIKQHLSELPSLTTPVPGELIMIYLSASEKAISTILLVERAGKQIPIYFISHMLKGGEERYASIEKATLALVYASRRLRRYFQAHPIQVITNLPIQQVLKRPEISGRLAKWAIEPGDFEISYLPRTSYKGQVLADFLTEAPTDDTTTGNITISTPTAKVRHLHTDAKPLAKITAQEVKRFVWENIVCRFGIPRATVSNNGKQFDSKPFRGCIMEGIKARLGRQKGAWLEELPHVLWAHRTMHKTGTGETPFSLTYGTEAMIPVEIGSPTPRTHLTEEENNADLRVNLNLLEERRYLAAIQEVKYKKAVEKYYNA
ncbi:hypothetical protein E3N88_11744 [Mikania micrantha]|uniref:Reverse transcriptase/retrotransposon-derived protein RNase H-like domain-containing protein n=1 Tax=Mikania micrantha TaxID=192012 RepID=A0A5N6P6K2_9ASTR|nr:hypothetical protein E3N88_11744 [Mikania micrantha]